MEIMPFAGHISPPTANGATSEVMSGHLSRGWGAWLGVLVVGAIVQACGDSAQNGGGAAGAGGDAVAGSTTSAGKSSSSAGTSSSNGGKSQGGASASGGKSQGGASASGGKSAGSSGSEAQGGANQMGGASSGGSSSGGSSNAMQSAGCGKPAPLTQATQQSVMVGADNRGYFLAPPAGYSSKKAYALVFAYHGSGGMARGCAATLAWKQPATARRSSSIRTGWEAFGI